MSSQDVVTSAKDAFINVQEWLLSKGRNYRWMGAMIKDYALTMRQNDIPLDRIYVGTTVIHPQLRAWAWKWELMRPEDVTEIPVTRAIYERRVEVAGEGAPMIQLELKDSLRLRASDESLPKASFDLFAKRSYVDLYGRQLVIYDEYSGGITYATKNNEGFTEDQIEFFDKVHQCVSCVIQLLLRDLCMHSLLCTYLGNDPGTHVHRGSIERGEGQTIRSVVWFSDIRGFTKMSAALSRDTLIALINDVFEESERALTSNGGEVLKFMGDGLMGVFTTEKEEAALSKSGGRQRSTSSDTTAGLCRNARKAAIELQKALATMRENRSLKNLPASDLKVGIGLHYGDVSYGNIGAPNRLDFTVIGPSVNLASRVESLCGKLGVSILATEEFVQREEDANGWDSRGSHDLKGVPDPVEVFELSRSS